MTGRYISTFINIVIITLLTVYCFSASAARILDTPDNVPVITPEQLIKNRSDFVVLDVRTVGEFALGHIEGAINISHRDVEAQLSQLKAINKPIVVHCRSGKRAAAAEAILLKNNITNIKHLEGDMLGWQEKELPLVRGLD